MRYLHYLASFLVCLYVTNVKMFKQKEKLILLYGTDWSLDTGLLWKMKYFDLNVQILRSFLVTKHPFQWLQAFQDFDSQNIRFLLVVSIFSLLLIGHHWPVCAGAERTDRGYLMETWKCQFYLSLVLTTHIPHILFWPGPDLTREH